MKLSNLRRGVAILGLSAFVVPCITTVDIAPNPIYRQGQSLAPREATEVTMRSEVVTMELFENRATVKAVFRLQNTGDKTEVLEVGFPTAAKAVEQPLKDGRVWDGPEDPGTIYNFAAQVDNKAVKADRKSLPKGAQAGPAGYRDWVCWQMQFAPQGKHVVTVTYEVETRDDAYVKPSPLAAREVSYILKTGRGWKGTIDSARVVVCLRDGLSLDQVEIATPKHEARDGNRLEWLFHDFEPDQDVFLRYRVYRNAKHAIQRLAPLLQGNGEEVDPEKLLQWAQNHEALDNHAIAAAAWAKLARMHTVQRGKATNRHITYQGLGNMPPGYHAARCYRLAGDEKQAQEWVRVTIKFVTKRLDKLDRLVRSATRRKKENLYVYERKALVAYTKMLEELRSWLKT